MSNINDSCVPQKTTVYLGYIEDDDKLDSEEESSRNKPCTSDNDANEAKSPWLINKIGGLPIYPYKPQSSYVSELEETLSLMQCKQCKSSCVLIFQITSPIDDSPLDRVIQIFTCVNDSCIQHSWFSMRSMFEPLVKDVDKLEDENFKSESLELLSDTRHGRVLVCKKRAFFKPYYLSVIEEPTGRENFAKNNLEALKLASKFIDPDTKSAPIEEKYKNLKNYKPPQQPAHLSDLDDFEKFQLEKLYSNDKVMYRFYKRVNRYPSQVVRYDWEGEPLLNSSKIKLNLQNCSSCSAKRKFELQLMSALLNYLHTEEKFDKETHDFSSILVHSCSKNCSTKTFNLEDTYFLPDPDSRIFNKVKKKILALKLAETNDEKVDTNKDHIIDPKKSDNLKQSDSSDMNASSKGKKKKKKKR